MVQKIPKHHKQLKHNLPFKDFFLQLLTRLSSCDLAETDKFLNKCMEDTAKIFNVDRVYVIFLSQDRTKWSIVCHWHKNGIDFPMENRQELDLGLYKWSEDVLMSGKPIIIDTQKDWPPEASFEASVSAQLGVKSQLIVPIQGRKNIISGWIGMESFSHYKHWDETTLERVKMVGEIVVNAYERKNAEMKTHELRNALAHVSRLRVLNELAAAMAHELNQPLTAILVYTNVVQKLLESGTTCIDKIRSSLSDIISEANMAGEIIHHIREPLKKSTGEVGPIDLKLLILEVLHLIKNDADRIGAFIDLKIGDNLPRVIGDKIQLEQVVINLLMNAIDAVQEKDPSNRRIEIDLKNPGDGSVIVQVTDSGPGIIEKNLEKIFELFFSTKNKGLGMGLAICRSILEEHGGRIWGERMSEGGARFVFSLPSMKAT